MALNLLVGALFQTDYTTLRAKVEHLFIRMGNGPDHMAMEGQTVLVDEPFELGNGVQAMQPGSSGVAGHDINCRCYASMELMDDEEFFACTGRHFPGWKKHGNVAETIEKSSENSIMEKTDIPILYAVGASGKNCPVRLPDGNHAKLAPGNTITKIKVFAGKERAEMKVKRCFDNEG